MDTHEINQFLGFDFGTKRIGVAVGQMITQTASPLGIVKNKNNSPDWIHIQRFLDQWKPDALVVGVPFNLYGEAQVMTAAAKRFMRQLHGRWHLPVYGVNECLSSVEAIQRAGRTYAVDAFAAQVILETWLMEKSSSQLLGEKNLLC